MITGLSDGNRAEGESLLLGFSVVKHTTKRSGGSFLVLGKKNYVVIDMKRKLVL
ncbi:hypothetical protein [Dorea formicigenerans]|uniref:hypothetical protein n=1 Tax=Dorea formicigenerans TaxID=39486 RepID=UPI0015FDA3C1|nr:hypothetical protein [Dorea formicigenerans]